VNSELMPILQTALGNAAIPPDVFASSFCGNVMDVSIDRLLKEQPRLNRSRAAKLFSELVGRLEYCCEHSRVFDFVTFEDVADADDWDRRFAIQTERASARSRALTRTGGKLPLPSSGEFTLLKLAQAFNELEHETKLVDVVFNNPVDLERLAIQAGVTALVSTYADHEIRWIVYFSSAEIACDFLNPAAKQPKIGPTESA
jgi:hypothetical protein